MMPSTSSPQANATPSFRQSYKVLGKQIPCFLVLESVHDKNLPPHQKRGRRDITVSWKNIAHDELGVASPDSPPRRAALRVVRELLCSSSIPPCPGLSTRCSFCCLASRCYATCSIIENTWSGSPWSTVMTNRKLLWRNTVPFCSSPTFPPCGRLRRTYRA